MGDRDEVERLAPYAVDGGVDAYGQMGPDPFGDYVSFEDYEALRQRAEAASAALSDMRRQRDHKATEARQWKADARIAQQEMLEALAQAAAAWEAGRDAAADMAAHGHHPRAIRALTPPADASAALTAKLDAERRACATECEMCPDENWGQWMAARIMARREGE